MVFGLIGPDPALTHASLVAVQAAIALTMFSTAAVLWSRRTAATVTALWLVLPNHTSLNHWASAANISLALLLTLLGWRLLASTGAGRSHVVCSGLLLAAGILFYEATAPAALLVAWYLLRRQGRAAGALLPVLCPVVLALLWTFAFWHPAKRRVTEWADLSVLWPAHFGWGVVPDGLPTDVTGVAAAVALTLVAVRALGPGRRSNMTPAERLIGNGVALIAAGTVPFVRYFYAPLGAGDRVNVVAGLGTALVWTGLFTLAFHKLPRPVFVPLVSATCVAFIVSHVEASAAWAAAGRHASESVERVAAGRRCGEPIVFTRGPTRRNVTAFLDTSNVTGAATFACGARIAATLAASEAPE